MAAVKSLFFPQVFSLYATLTFCLKQTSGKIGFFLGFFLAAQNWFLSEILPCSFFSTASFNPPECTSSWPADFFYVCLCVWICTHIQSCTSVCMHTHLSFSHHFLDYLSSWCFQLLLNLSTKKQLYFYNSFLR